MDAEFIDKNSAEIIKNICFDAKEFKIIMNSDKLTHLKELFLLESTLSNHINKIFSSENKTILINNIDTFNMYLEDILRYTHTDNAKSDSFKKAELTLKNLYDSILNLKINLNKL